jgi:hypothetical protein
MESLWVPFGDPGVQIEMHIFVGSKAPWDPLLVNAPGKRYVQLAEGTHTIAMEKTAMKLFEVAQAFLDESGRS